MIAPGTCKMEQEDDYVSEDDEDYVPEAGAKKKNRKKETIETTQIGRGGVQSAQPADPLADLKEKAKKAKVNAVWAQLNAPKVVKKTAPSVSGGLKQSSGGKAVSDWMVSLGLGKPMSRSATTSGSAVEEEKGVNQSDTKESEEAKASDEARAVAAAAIAAARAAQAAVDLEGRPQVTEVRDFAGERIEVTRTVDPKAPSKRKEQPASGLDALIQQIEKKKKINILDKSRKDWGEYKDEQGVTEQLEEYKKSNDKYLDKVAFLQRAEVREYEVERDQKLAAARKKGSS